MTNNFAMLHKLLDNVSAAVPDKVALIVEDKTYNYGELSSLTQSLAASLLERGIQPRDRVAFLLPNCLEIVLCYYACFKIGAIAVPLNIRFHTELLQYGLNQSGARILITEPALFENIEKIRPMLAGVEECYLNTPSSKFAGVQSFSELLDATFDPDCLSLIEESHAAAIYYTSGTTGLPKAVIHSHASLAKATENQITQIAITPED